MTLTGIHNLDIISGKLLSPGYIVASWTDDQLKWNHTSFNDVDRFSVSSNDIWTPGFIQFDATGFDMNMFPSWVYDNGTVIQLMGGLFEGACELDVLRYPFDEHVCVFSMQPDSSDASEIDLKVIPDTHETNLFSNHGEWEVTDSFSNVIDFVEPITYFKFKVLTRTLKISRRHMFTTVHTSIPLMLLALLNVFVFVVPLNSGERITFSVSILLNYVFFTSSISDDLPHNSVRLSYSSIFMATINVTTTLDVIASVILCRMYHETIFPVPDKLKRFVCRYISCRLRKKKTVNKVESLKTLDLKDADEISYIGKDIPNLEVTDDNEEIKVTWATVAEMLDAILFDIHLLVVCTISIVFVCLFNIG